VSRTDEEIARGPGDVPTLVMLYGPPASGKTTVGRELAELTGFRLFINHLTVTPAKALFPDGEPAAAYFALLSEWRLTGITAALRAGASVVFTMVYSGSPDDSLIARIVAAVRAEGGRGRFVELHAPVPVLTSRVGNESRAKLGKMTTPDALRRVLEDRDVTASVAYPEITIRLDTSIHAPDTAARRIADEFALTTRTTTTPAGDVTSHR
jgi:shikimate kinase